MLTVEIEKPVVRGEVNPGGSKSITNRVLIMRALAGVQMPIFNASASEDTTTLNRLLKEDSADWNVGDAGTAARFSAAFLAARPGRETILRGSERMNERPMKPLFDALSILGAEITYLEKEGFLPVRITGTKLKGGTVKLPHDVSSQFVSALAMVAPYGASDLVMEFDSVPFSKPYLDMTLSLLQSFYVSHEEEFLPGGGYRLTIFQGTPVLPPEYHVEPDWSSASYWYAAVALADLGEVELEGYRDESVQGDAVIASLFEALGVSTRFTDGGMVIRKTGLPESDYFEFDFTDYPDLVPAFAVALPFLGVESKLSGLHTLRFKESDRVQVIKANLNALGIAAKTEAEGTTLFIPGAGSTRLNLPVELDSAGDHRMVMGFFPAVLKARSIRFSRGDEVKKSYPAFWHDVKNVCKTADLTFG